ncbi:MAG: hypothetical protein EXQ55_00780 [Acidobacteria bacterium]|nr:hypothetical protein [Acidobacteriota bacterium]
MGGSSGAGGTPRERASERAAQAVPGILARHRERIIAVLIDLNATFGLAWIGVLFGFAYWPSVAIAAVCYTVLATAFVGRSFGPMGSQWLLRALKSVRPTRCLVSSRAEGA